MQKILSVLLTAVLFTGCASIIKGTQETITVTSDKDADIYVNNIRQGTEVAQVRIKKGKPATIRVTKDGCRPTITQTGEAFDPVSLLGIIIDFGLITIPIDMISGAAWKVEPTMYNVTPDC